MSSIEKVLYFLQKEMNTPTRFGWFHIMWILFAVITLFLLYKRKNKYSEKQLKTVLGVYSIIALILETLKQLIWSFNYDQITNIVTWDYEWYSFPFQLCTTPIYVCLLCLFLKKGKFRDSLLSFISYITILGSISTIILPDSCFTSDILVNIHTMWLHIGSFIVSVYLLINKETKINIKSLSSAVAVFLIFVSIALYINILFYNLGFLNGETFNMFFISPYFISTLPVFNVLQEKVPYLIFLTIYIVSLITGGLLIYIIAKTVNKLYKKRKV